MERLRRQRGFTLIELLISVVILAILAAVIYSTMLAPKDRTKASRAIAAVQDAYAQSQSWKTRSGDYAGFDNDQLSGQLETTPLPSATLPGDETEPNLIYLSISGQTIVLCANATRVAAYCIRDDDQTTTYRRIEAGGSDDLATLAAQDDQFSDKWVD